MEKQKEVGDLAHEAMVASIPAKPIQPQAEVPSQPTPANTQRWIDSFSDCC